MKRLPVLRQLFLLGWLSLATVAAAACPVCRPKVQAGIHNEAFSANVVLVLLPVALLLAGGIGLFFAADIRHYFHARRA